MPVVCNIKWLVCTGCAGCFYILKILLFPYLVIVPPAPGKGIKTHVVIMFGIRPSSLVYVASLS